MHVFRTVLAAGFAASMAVAGAAVAADNNRVSGFVGVNLGATWTDFETASTTYGGTDSAFVFGGEGHVNAWLSSDMSVQLDVEGEATTEIEQRIVPNGGAWDGRSGGIFGGHVSWRDPQSHLFGAFAAFSSQSNLDYDGTMTNAIIGVEGQYYSGPLTLYGQAGFAPLMSDSDEYEPENLWFLRGVGRYFWTENDRLQAEFGYASSDVRGSPDGYNLYNWGLSWRHRYDNTPFSTTVAYTGFDLDNTDANQWAKENILTVAFAIHFGDNTLQQTDREGATLEMPQFNRAQAWSYWTGR